MHAPALLAALLVAALPCRAAPAPPAVMLWAWERPADLRHLPPTVGVAFLAASLYLSGQHLRAVPRFQPLRVGPGTFRMAVIRIETPATQPASSVALRDAAVEAIMETIRVTQPDAVQIDFDARVSERPFYAALLRRLRTRLGPALFLSITALVSWCGTRSWLERLPVDEVVPMTFEMGSTAGAAETLLRSSGEFESPACRNSLGLATPDLPFRPRRYRRTYVFAYENWSALLTRAVLAQLQ